MVGFFLMEKPVIQIAKKRGGGEITWNIYILALGIGY
jgi:hypothetical protein